ncbi:hypothetical protein ACX3YG_14480 [Pseudomonas wadenswilerensis]
MPTENRSATTNIPPVIGETPLGGSFYAVECTRCGWLGSSEELTDDCQCTQPDGEHACLGDTDEIGPERLLGIVQAMAKQQGKHQSGTVETPEPYGYLREVEGRCQLSVGPERPADRAGGYATPWAAVFAGEQVEKLRAELAEMTTFRDNAASHMMRIRSEATALEKERDELRAQLAERDALLTWWKNHLGVHLSILFGTSGHTPEEADKSADDIIRRAEQLAPQPSTSTEPNTPLCDHDFTDDGQHLLVCTACGYTEDHDPKWRPIETAPTDGTLVRLLVEFEENSTEDDQQAPTIGHNSFQNNGADEWQFAGWNWSQDCYTSGQGTPVGWLPLFDSVADTTKS